MTRTLPPRPQPGQPVPAAGNWHTIPELETHLGIGRGWITPRLAKLSYQPEWRLQRNPTSHPIVHLYYPPECLTELEGLLHIWRSYPVLGQWWTLRRAADQLGQSRDWVTQTIKRHNLPDPSRRRTPDNRLALAISPWTLRQLKKLQLPLAPPNAWTLSQLSQETGWGEQTIMSTLKQRGHEPSKFRSGVTGQPGTYFPSEVLRILGTRPNHIPPGGTWFTSFRMSSLLNRSLGWVKARLTRPIYAVAGQRRLDDRSMIRQHYPPWVYFELKQESDHLYNHQETRQAG